MRRLIRAFEASDLAYLLVGGQASIVYGAATFSEDVDVWIEPSRANLDRLLHALAGCGARVHKLTPPVELRHARRGHGFHFVVPGRPLPTYLDVMGRPPRVGSFRAASARCRRVDMPWGKVPLVSIRDLVELKKTRRLSDYEVISNLVLVRLGERPKPGPALLRWAARNSFRAEDRRPLLARLGEAVTESQCRRDIATEIARLQAKDVAHWRSRLAELRELRASRRLLAEGVAVRTLTR
jgi:hypothetical protein